MDARFYNSDEIDIEQLANNLENIYRAQNYQVQQVGSRDQVMIQLKKGSDFEALIGMQAALSVILQRSGGGVIAMIGQQRWIDKAAVGAVGIIAAPVLWPLMLTAGAGAIRQASLGNQVLNVVDGLVRQQRPEIQVGPVPVQIMPKLQQQYIPPPQYTPPAYIPPPQYTPPAYTPPQPVVNALPSSAPAAKQLRCPTCNTPYQPGDTYCSGCGKSLVTLCPNCKSEVQDNASFCPKCGASIFQPLAATQAAPPVQPQTPGYTPYSPPPVEQSPVYTPPPTPAYTPPAQQTPVYTPPPEPEPYVPPVPKEPPVMPKTTITYTPSAPRQEAPPVQKQPPQQEVYYTPPPDLSPAPPKPQTPPVRPQPIAPKPIAAKSAAQPAYDPAATWGYLAFSDGNQIRLSGERAVVGRYDHDIGGIQPEADLSSVPGSDTVSRIHAALEHIGSTFTVTDLNSTNSTRLNGKRLEPDKATPINDGDSLSFGKATCTFKKA
jgi:hypothetical protein